MIKYRAMDTTDGRPEDLPTLAGNESESANTVASPQMSLGKVGRYKITRLIGEGGMGAVYEAEQEQPRRTVALKVIKPGLASPELLRRFAQESQALGRLQHPGIAQIYDAGTADTGYGPQPYFAMEFIRGETLLDHAKSHRLNTNQRLELIVKVCEAVHHAHQRGLIHRDLKPGNILVDETGQPKILDFGVARVTDSDAQATMQTDIGQLVGTLAYMSPEQVLADPLELDTRSDVYALGVIFYELLSGKLPYNISKKLHEALHAIREEDPSRLSMIDRNFRGDIETIAAKALEKDKARRYASAAELAADITHYLKDEPIIAQPPTTSYQLKKFARRHKALVGGLAAVFVVLVLGVVASTYQMIRAIRAESAATLDRDRAKAAEQNASTERDKAVKAEAQAVSSEAQAKVERDKAVEEKKRADIEAATARAVTDFMQKNLFEQVVGGAERGASADVGISSALDRAASKIQGNFAKDPLVEAGVHEAVANAYGSLFLWDKAAPQAQQALALRTKVQGAEDPATLRAAHFYGAVISNQRRLQESLDILTKTVAIQKRTLGADHPDTLKSMFDISVIYLADSKADKGEPYIREAAERRLRLLGPGDKDSILTSLTAVKVYLQLKRMDQALKWADIAYEGGRKSLGENDPMTLSAQSTQQAVKLALAPPASAADRQAAQTQVLEAAVRAFDNRQAGSVTELISLAIARTNVAIGQQRPAEAERPLVEALDAARRAGREEPNLIALLAGVYAQQKKFTEGEDSLRRLLQNPSGMRELAPTIMPFVYRSFGSNYKAEKRYADAEPHYVRLITLMLASPGEREIQTRVDIVQLAELYAGQLKWTDAQKSYVQVSEIQRRLAPDNINTEATVIGLGWAHYQQGHYTEAEKIFRECGEIVRRIAANSWERFNLDNMLGATLAAQKKFAEAEPLLVSGYEGMLGKTPSTNPNLMGRFTKEQAGQAIVQMYADWGKADKRAEWAEKTKAN
jgi:tetratricopeptide (TPR) repeat protein